MNPRTRRFCQLAFALYAGRTGELRPAAVLDAAYRLTGTTPANLNHALDLLDEGLTLMHKDIKDE